MKYQKTVRRFISAVLAAELFFAPAAMARAANPRLIFGGETRENAASVPVTGETSQALSDAGREETAAIPTQSGTSGTQSEVSGTLSAVGDSYAAVSFAAAVSPGLELGYKNGLTLFDNQLTYEMGEKIQNESSPWILRLTDGNDANAYKGPKVLMNGENGNYYVLMPNSGRVPDYKLEGYYVVRDSTGKIPDQTDSQGNIWYSFEDASNSAAVAQWSYLEGGQYSESYKLTQDTDYAALTKEEKKDRLEKIGLWDSGDIDVEESDYTRGSLWYFTAQKMEAMERDGALAKIVESDETGTEYAFYYLPLVARWVKSDTAGVRALALSTAEEKDGDSEKIETLYTADPRARATAATMKVEDIGTDTVEEEFWYIAGKEQGYLNLDMTAFEPYFDYVISGEGDCPLKVEYTFDGVTHQAEINEKKMVPMAQETTGGIVAQNSAKDPARSVWTVKNIPLKSADETSGADKNNTVKITLTSPSGKVKKTLTLHIERVTDAAGTLNYGNTPAGLIWADEGSQWGATAAEIQANKERSIAYFQQYHSFQDMPIYPQGFGTLYQGEYSALAWAGGDNLDLDETAVVAYLDSAFDDPGVRFTDCQGEEVVYGNEATGDYKTCVTRTIKLKTAEKLTVDLYTDANGGTTQWYTAGGMAGTETAQTLTKSDGNDVVNLRGVNVIPGIYDMVYTFTDPLDCENGKTTSVTRKLVILPIPGDVDMDGAVTAADARAIKSNKESWERNNAADTKTRTRLLEHRIYNVKKGSKMAEEAIWDGFQPVAPGESTTTDYFYPPLSATGLGEQYNRKTWGQVADSTGASGSTGALTLKYLGREHGTIGSGGTITDLSGPWNADPKEAVSQGDVFWVGIELDATNSGLKGKELQDLTLTLSYDSSFVAPAEIYTADEVNSAVSGEKYWTMLTLFNFNMSAGQNSHASSSKSILYGINGSQYSWDSSSYDRSYSTHYSKVLGALESSNSSGTLREMTFTIQHLTGNRVKLKDGYLLVVPFKLVSQPAGVDSGSFIELSAGMKELVITTVEETSAVASLLRGVSPLAGLLGVGESQTTRAFSAQNDIFGDNTENLREKVEVTAGGTGNSRAVLAVPLGENTVPSTLLENKWVDGDHPELNGKTIYGYQFQTTLPDQQTGEHTSGTLPPGLTYTSNLGVISGIPTKAGTYDFTIGGKAYRIVVAKRELHYSVKSVSSYYGEAKYRGKNATEDFTFTYDPTELYQEDYNALLAANENHLDGNGTELSATTDTGADRSPVIAGYTKFKLEVKENNDLTSATVTATTPVREERFYILTAQEAKADNYEFIRREDQATLQILRRPIWIKSITAEYPLENPTVFIYNNDGPTREMTFSLDEEETPRAVVELYRPDSTEIFDGRPLTAGVERVEGDVFTLNFTGNYARNLYDAEHDDTQTANWFILENSVEHRDVISVREITLTGDCAGNYTLQNKRLDDTNSHIQAPVVRRDIESIVISDYPPVLKDGGSMSAGEVVSSDQSLRVGLGLSNDTVGDFSYIYVGPDLKAWNLHYNWVSPEEKALGEANPDTGVGMGWDPTKPDGEQDNCAYDNKTIITAAMNGWYLCVSAQRKDGTFIKVYSTNALKVTKRSLQLYPQESVRFYGEGENMTYRYEPSGLSTADRTAINTHFGISNPKGTQEELEWLLTEEYGKTETGVTLPKLVGSTTIGIPETGKETDPYTPVSGKKYVILSGGSCSGYNFLYYQTYGADATTGDNKSGWSSEFGTALLTVKRRPVIVDAVYTPDAEAADGRANTNFATIYADTYSLKLTGQQAGDTFTEFKTTLKQGDVALVDFKLPEKDTRGYYSYYTGQASNAESVSQNLSGNAVLEEDLGGLEVQYAVNFIPDVGHRSWQDMATNWFESVNGQRDVEIRDLTLKGTRAANYILVYSDSNHAQQKAPDQAQPDTQGRFNPVSEGVTHLVYGKGNVVLRPIKTMELQYLGRLDYTYGETFSPGETGENNRRFTLKVSYETYYGENAAPFNTTSSETVEYSLVALNGETGVTYSDSFTQRGFTFHYLKEGQTVETVGEGQLLKQEDKLYPAEHNGARVYITGKRSEEDEIIYSNITDKTVLKVEKANLTIKAADAHRFYGEANPAGDFTFTLSDLAQWDLERLNLTTAPTKNQQGTSAQFATVFGTDAKNGIAVSSAAAATSKAYDGAHDYGSYDMTASVTGGETAETLLDNYDLTLEKGTLYVYPRPIRVTKIENSEENPIYTVYSATKVHQFPTGFSTDDSTNPVRVAAETLTGQAGYNQKLADGITKMLPLTKETALVGTDRLAFTATVIFPDSWNLNSGSTDETKQVVTLTDLKPVNNDMARNYSYIGTNIGANDRFWGKVKLRTINNIYIVGKPTTEYTYPESLDLSGLKVSIGYDGKNGETNITATVPFLSTEQFESYGLYVNYYDANNSSEKDKVTSLSSDVWKTIPSSFRKAATSDHLTIAPTHDAQRAGTNWAANGKYLVISAFQAGDEQTAAKPKVLGERKVVNGVESYEGDPIALKIAPQKLSFELEAADKTYDGTTRAAGTLTLTNLFDRKNVQYKVEKDGSANQTRTEDITDAVYVAVGAGYEGGSTYQTYTAAGGYKVENGKISFTTGTYENTAVDALSANSAIRWAANYQFGQHLTFNFVNANVHYADENSKAGYGTQALRSYWRQNQAKNDANGTWDHYGTVTTMPVEVTNMTLAGPDAANYTWGESNATRVESTSVTMETRAEEKDGQAAAPYATIHKANRDTIQTTLTGENQMLWPSLQLDLHSNAIRFVYNEALLTDLANRWNNANANSGESDDFMDELHFEYALFYQDGDLLKQWAGKDGSARRGYQDTRFFGGETVRVNVDAGYEPDPERLDKEENAGEDILLKGQVYPWAEEDTGASGKGYVEDGGFTLYDAVYPGGAAFAEYYQWYYKLYTTDRTALPRDTVFYPLIRLSETHNYNASAPISGSGDVDSRTLLNAQLALETLEEDSTDAALQSAAKDASKAVFDAAKTNMTADAAKAAADKVAYDAELAEKGQWPEDGEAQPLEASALKTFIQRIDLVSASQERMEGRDTEYLVEMLEAVWFTDTQFFDDSRELDAVVWNHPTRYYGYYWDARLSSVLKFTEEPYIDLTGELEVTVRDETGNETLVTVNQDHNAKIYVSITNDDGQEVRKIEIVPSILYARLGDEPYQLGVITDPARPSNRRYTWTTSDASVATVDEAGLVTFRGVGQCVITVTTTNNRCASISVIVSATLLLDSYETPVFNFFYDQAWEKLNEGYEFRPTAEMTRGELALLLDKFLSPNGSWQATTELAYLDIQEGDKYYDALRRLTGAKVVYGVPGSRFAPEQKVTRAEFATMLTRMLRLNLPQWDDKSVFLDSGREDTWAWAYIDALAKTGATRGVGGGYFAPDRILTREESAVILARLLVTKLSQDEPGLLIPTDVAPENWSYASILRAVNAVVYPD